MVTLSWSPPSYKQFMPLSTLLLNCFRRDSSMTLPPHLNIFHCYPHQPLLPPTGISIVHPTPSKNHEAPCPAAQHHPTQPYFPRFQNEESMSLFKMSGSISIFKASISMFKKCIKYINIFKKYINICKKKYIIVQNKYIDIQKVH